MEQSSNIKRYKQVAAALLLAIMLAAGGVVLWSSGKNALHYVQQYDFSQNIWQVTDLWNEVEDEIRYGLPYRIALRDVYSTGLLLQNKRATNDFYIIKDNAGFLHQTNLYQRIDPDIMDYAKRLRRMQSAAHGAGSQLLFVGTSGKLIPGVTKLPAGYLPDYASLRNLDALFLDLLATQVKTLDLRLNFKKAPLEYSDYYYRTDSVWTARAAQFAAGCIAQSAGTLFSLPIDPDGYFADISNYNAMFYPNPMQGDYGYTVGVPFGGMDDFVVFSPTFKTDLTVTLIGEGGVETVRRGDFSQAVLDYSQFEEQDRNYTALYYGEEMVRVTIKNHLKPGGGKILLLCDQNFFTTASYLALMCAEVNAVLVPSNAPDDIEALVGSGDYDLVLVACQAKSVSAQMFSFFDS